MMEELRRKGVVPTVILPDDGGICATLVESGIDVHVLSFRMNTYPNFRTVKDCLLFLPRTLGRLCLNSLAAWRLRRILVQRGVEIVHTNVSVVGIGHRAAHLAGIPHIYHFREYAGLIGYHFLPSAACFYRSVRGQLDYNICITKGVQAYHHQSASPRSVVIYDGVCRGDVLLPVVVRDRYFLFAGRLERVKGLMVLLRAYAAARTVLGEQLPPLLVAGALEEPEYVAAVRSYIADNDLQTSVQLLGDRDDIYDLMRRAQAIVVPSLSEGFGLCVAEAMLNGCIVVGADNTGIREQLDNGQRLMGQPIGFRFTNEGELSDLLCELSRCDSDNLEPMRQRAFEAARRLYSVDVNVDNVYALYLEALSKKTCVQLSRYSTKVLQ